MSKDRDASLVMDALMMAVWRRGKADALLHHSDQGSQYTSEQFQLLLLDNGITCSMTRASRIYPILIQSSIDTSDAEDRHDSQPHRPNDFRRS